MPKAIDMDKAFDQAFQRGEAAPVEDYGRKLGNSLIEGLIGQVAEKAQAHLLGGGHDDAPDDGSLDKTLAQLLKYRMLQGMFGGERESTDGGTATIMKAILDSNANMTKYMVEAQSKSEERTMALVREMREEARAAQDRLEQRLEQAKGGDELAQIGKQLIFNQLQSDPEEAFARRRQQFFDEFERLHGGQDKVTNLEEYKVKKSIELKEKEIDAQIEAEKERAKYQSQILGGLFSAVGPGQAAGNAPAPVGAPAVTPGLHRFQCARCAQEFALPHAVEPGSLLTCPHCQGQIQVAGGPPAPPPPDLPGGMPFEEADGL